jgi:hypothetical protein
MRLIKFMTVAAVALSVAGAPVLAQTAPTAATKLAQISGKDVRKGAKTQAQSDIRGGSLILALLAAGLVITGVVIAADSDDEPQSP